MPCAPAPRVSLRRKIKPSWFKDYTVSSITTSGNSCLSTITILQNCPIDANNFGFGLYSIIPSTVYSCAINKPVVKEPYSYNQAITDPHWIDAMSKELLDLETSNTWTLMPLLLNKKVIGCRWVYRVFTMSSTNN